ncbi:hypothetical protein [Myxococcus sp. RHSTA-1-4]|uniref:hypothetical protein n=1 Tax=Myxococcus sp. RHSTA-1-4 TaxID=2874601 RepID=UPI001CBDD241|nr:hypothetical protein [Myxococcus sp. RHSTA-1-4]MBZ4416587.1 hypothetical protein [Myxococcus sp. RHSTA-1-4]
MSHRFVVAASIWVLAACSGVELKPTSIPEPEDLRRTFALGDDVIYSPDDTFKNTPELWLGRVGVVRRTAADCSTGGRLRWDGAYVRNATATAGEDTNLAYPVAAKVTDPEIQAQTLVTQKSLGSIAALSFVSAQLDQDSAAEVILTAFATQRVMPGPRWESAYNDYIASHEKLLADPDVCYVFVVTGYSHKTLISKRHQKVTADAKGGYSGVNVNGTYMANTDGYRLSHLFALSPTVIKDTTGVPKELRASRKLAEEDVLRLQQLILEVPKEP